jgi:hypothetical protein
VATAAEAEAAPGAARQRLLGRSAAPAPAIDLPAARPPPSVSLSVAPEKWESGWVMGNNSSEKKSGSRSEWAGDREKSGNAQSRAMPRIRTRSFMCEATR